MRRSTVSILEGIAGRHRDSSLEVHQGPRRNTRRTTFTVSSHRDSLTGFFRNEYGQVERPSNPSPPETEPGYEGDSELETERAQYTLAFLRATIRNLRNIFTDPLRGNRTLPADVGEAIDILEGAEFIASSYQEHNPGERLPQSLASFRNYLWAEQDTILLRINSAGQLDPADEIRRTRVTNALILYEHWYHWIATGAEIPSL